MEGFGNKVPIYPGYVVATAASLVIGKPVKWVESRSENLISTGFGRDYYMKGELAVSNEGRIPGLEGRHDLRSGGLLRRCAADQVPGRTLPHRHRRSYDYPVAHVNDAETVHEQGTRWCRLSVLVPGDRGVPHPTERLLFLECGRRVGDPDPAEFRIKNFIQPEQFPYHSPTGFVYDSGDYEKALRLAMGMLDHQALRAEQAAARQEGRLMGIGIASFTEVVGAGNSKEFDIAGLKMFDSAEA